MAFESMQPTGPTILEGSDRADQSKIDDKTDATQRLTLKERILTHLGSKDIDQANNDAAELVLPFEGRSKDTGSENREKEKMRRRSSFAVGRRRKSLSCPVPRCKLLIHVTD